MSIEREYLIAISIDAGLITLIDPDGEIGVYRQRGIDKFNDVQLDYLVQNRFLNKSWRNYKEVPKNWSLSFDDTEMMGKARVTFHDIFKLRG